MKKKSKQPDEVLRESEELYRTLVETSPDSIVMYSLSGEILAANSQAAKVYGVPSVAEFLSEVKTVSNLLSEESKALAAANLRRILTEGLSKKNEYLACIRGGKTLPVEINTSVVRTATGEPKAFISVIRDITERKRADEALRESEERYRHLVTYAPAGIYEVDLTSRRFLSVNDIMCQLSGYTREEFLSMDPLQLLTEESGRAFMQRLAKVLCGEQVPDTVEFKARGKNGREFWVLLNTRYSYGADNRITAMVVAHDITERKQAEAERMELERRLLDAQRLESLGILAGGIAHDFNNLLMAILGNLDMTLMNLPLTSSSRFTIEQAVQATRRATDLTRQLLAYSGKGRFLVTPMDMNELVKENAELFRTVIHRTVTMDLRLTTERACIEADAGQVQQVIMNLITNASEAIDEKPGQIILSTGVQDCDDAYLNKSQLGEKPPAGKYVYLEVTDDGQGMNEETIQHLFDPFFTTKFLGRGLGMSAVLGIVRGHKGAIIIESKTGQGTTIRVLFPAYDAGSTEQVDIPGTSLDITAKALFSGMVLVVDDEEMVRSLCTDFLQHIGFRTMSAADGEEALMLLQKHSDEITLVLLDLTMPKMDGLRALQEMKHLRPDIKVILCSGYSEKDATQRFTRLGLDGFLQKPFRMKDLKEKVAGVLTSSSPTSTAKT